MFCYSRVTRHLTPTPTHIWRLFHREKLRWNTGRSQQTREAQRAELCEEEERIGLQKGETPSSCASLSMRGRSDRGGDTLKIGSLHFATEKGSYASEAPWILERIRQLTYLSLLTFNMKFTTCCSLLLLYMWICLWVSVSWCLCAYVSVYLTHACSYHGSQKRYRWLWATLRLRNLGPLKSSKHLS